MQFNNLQKFLDKVYPPSQPYLRSIVNNYSEKLIKLSPVNIKSKALCYQFTTGDKKEYLVPIIPDVCINFIFSCNLNNPAAKIKGLNLNKDFVNLEPNTTYFGIKPYSTFGMKKGRISTYDLFGEIVNFEDLFRYEGINEKIAKADTFKERINLFQNQYLEKWVDDDYISDLAEYSAMLICASKGQITMANIAKTLGYSERHCRKKFTSYYKIPPIKYSRIIRFQNSLNMLLYEKTKKNISYIAHENGYYDEAHYINDFKLFTNTSPYEFKKEILSL